MVDIAWVVLNAVCAVLQAVYELFKPPPLKSVRLETALVSRCNVFIILASLGGDSCLISYAYLCIIFSVEMDVSVTQPWRISQ